MSKKTPFIPWNEVCVPHRLLFVSGDSLVANPPLTAYRLPVTRRLCKRLARNTRPLPTAPYY
jgi:hypothetical protein